MSKSEIFEIFELNTSSYTVFHELSNWERNFAIGQTEKSYDCLKVNYWSIN